MRQVFKVRELSCCVAVRVQFAACTALFGLQPYC